MSSWVSLRLFKQKVPWKRADVSEYKGFSCVFTALPNLRIYFQVHVKMLRFYNIFKLAFPCRFSVARPPIGTWGSCDVSRLRFCVWKKNNLAESVTFCQWLINRFTKNPPEFYADVMLRSENSLCLLVSHHRNIYILNSGLDYI